MSRSAIQAREKMRLFIMAKEQTSITHRILTIIGTVLCIILVPILVINVTLIIKSFVNKDAVPSVGGYLPLIVLTDSMYPEIESGDLIICHTAKADEIQVRDIIAFFDPAGNGTTIVTHRVLEIKKDQGISFITKGDNNNTEDKLPVPEESLVGVYRKRIPGAGNIAMFMQTSTGLIVCVVIPIILLVAYDVIRRRIYEKNRQDDNAALIAELEALRAEKAAKEAKEKAVANDSQA